MKTALTYIAITLVAFVATCLAVEWYLCATSDANNESFEGKYAAQPDPILGYAPVPPASGALPVRSRRILRGKVLYDVEYTAGADGWRVTPQHPDATRAVLFFGDSYTMGEGVNDAETYPYIVGQMLGPEYQVYNFGLSGYGPHQFAALLESGRLDSVFKKYPRVDVFFMNIWGHEFRSGGYSVWDTHGPRYVLKDGRAIRRGDFSRPEEPGWLNETAYAVKRALMRTQLCTKVLLRILRWNAEPLLNVQSAILVRARDYLSAHYAHTTFTVIVYPTVMENIPRFERAGLRVLDIKPALPGWPGLPDVPDGVQYRIPGDRHPTPLANQRTAEGIVEYIKACP